MWVGRVHVFLPGSLFTKRMDILPQEVSKLRGSGLDFSNSSEIWQALLLRCLSNFRAIRSLWHPISWLRDFTRSCGKTYDHLTHSGRATHICVSKLTIIASDNGLSPDRRQAIIWTNAGILLIGPLGTNFSEILIEIETFSFNKMHLKISSGKWRPSCLGLNVLMNRSPG